MSLERWDFPSEAAAVCTGESPVGHCLPGECGRCCQRGSPPPKNMHFCVGMKLNAESREPVRGQVLGRGAPDWRVPVTAVPGLPLCLELFLSNSRGCRHIDER